MRMSQRIFSFLLWVVSSAFMLTAVTSCGHVDERELQEECASGVVMVQNRAYYELQLPNLPSLFFSDFDPNLGFENFVDDVAKLKPAKGYGTGFFVSKDGKIVTNHHVIAGEDHQKTVSETLKQQLHAAFMQLLERYNELLYKSQEYEEQMNYYDEDSPEMYTLREEYNQTKAQLQELAQTAEGMGRIDVDRMKIVYHSQVGVVYNHVAINENTTFYPCKVLRSDVAHDLALLQLEDKKTPLQAHVFDVPDDDPLTAYTFTEKIAQQLGNDKNAQIFMLSYNLGPQLSLTKDGLLVQFNKGYVSQRSSDRLLYSIPTLPGSSGSPVFNAKGELVAINFAGYSGTQSFNYGVPVRFLRQLIKSL